MNIDEIRKWLLDSEQYALRDQKRAYLEHDRAKYQRKANRFAAAVSELDRLRARVAELEKERDDAERAVNEVAQCSTGEIARLERDIADRDAAIRVLCKCIPFVEADAQMVADLTRHAPLDAASQARHDNTEAASEALLREIASNPIASAAVRVAELEAHVAALQKSLDKFTG